jgi:hypothetical protein
MTPHPRRDATLIYDALELLAELGLVTRVEELLEPSVIDGDELVVTQDEAPLGGIVVDPLSDALSLWVLEQSRLPALERGIIP